jgi:hypothetical protein
MRKLNWREGRTLLAFERQAVLRFCDLPTYVGSKTMAALVELGLVELVDRSVGEYAKGRCWRRTKKRL